MLQGQGAPGDAVTRSTVLQEALAASCPDANSTIADGTRSCFKGLLPPVPRQQHLSRPATTFLVELLDVDEPFLTALALADEWTPLAPAQLEPTRRLLHWSARIALAAYQHRERTMTKAREDYARREGPVETKEARDRCRARWQTAVRVAALNLVADGIVRLEHVDALPAELGRLTVADIWAALPEQRVVDDTERRWALDRASSILLDRRDPWLRLVAREGLGPAWSDEVLARAAKKLVDSRSLDGQRTTEQFVTTVVQSVVKDVRAEISKGPIPIDHTDEWVIATIGATTATSGAASDDPADVVVERLTFGAAPSDPRDGSGRSEISRVLARMVRTGPREGVHRSVLDAHVYARDRLNATRSVPPREGLPRWYERYYVRTLGAPPAVASARAGERLRELRHAVAHGCFPPSAVRS